jgi:hypothetical protein
VALVGVPVRDAIICANTSENAVDVILVGSIEGDTDCKSRLLV